ncbi:MAG TPA: circadian clock KaiB family protein, partial [Vicinamibacteria bacterium]|nr:circadian clock KaiB family protein [Vicinamibacteria bacterium]
MALEGHGYGVERCASAAEALAHLRRSRFDVVIGHYGLPDKTAAALFQEARREGLLDGTATLVLSGQPDPVGVHQEELIRKPLDLNRLLSAVASAAKGRSPGPVPPATESATAPVELALYVTMPWPSSLKAKRNMERVLAGFSPSQVRLTICDLAKEPERAEADGIVFSPTLVKRSPEPRAWVMGDLSDRRVLSNLLLMCGLEPRKKPR